MLNTHLLDFNYITAPVSNDFQNKLFVKLVFLFKRWKYSSSHFTLNQSPYFEPQDKAEALKRFPDIFEIHEPTLLPPFAPYGFLYYQPHKQQFAPLKLIASETFITTAFNRLVIRTARTPPSSVVRHAKNQVINHVRNARGSADFGSAGLSHPDYSLEFPAVASCYDWDSAILLRP